MSQEPMGQTVEMPAGAMPAAPQTFDSGSDRRAESNVMRHQYKVLSEAEKKAMEEIKDLGLALHRLLDGLGQSRELSLAKTKAEESVMWGVKHITR